MINNQLIDSALKLTGNTMEDMNIKAWQYHEGDIYTGENFSIEKFCFYLLSPSFIEKYYSAQKPGYIPEKTTLELLSGEFGYAIYEYQSGNHGPLIDLLTKIPCSQPLTQDTK